MALAGVVALVVLKVATPARLTRAGLSTTHWLALLLVVGGTAVLLPCACARLAGRESAP